MAWFKVILMNRQRIGANVGRHLRVDGLSVGCEAGAFNRIPVKTQYLVEGLFEEGKA